MIFLLIPPYSRNKNINPAAHDACFSTRLLARLKSCRHIGCDTNIEASYAPDFNITFSAYIK